MEIFEVFYIAHEPECPDDGSEVSLQLLAPLFDGSSGRHGYLTGTPGKNFVGVQDDRITFFLELIGKGRRRRDRIDFSRAEHFDMGRVVPIAEHRVLNLFDLGLRVNAGLFQCLFNEKFDETAAVGRDLPDTDLAAAEFADIGDMFRAIPFEERRVAPAPDDVDIGAFNPLTEGRLCVCLLYTSDAADE